MALSQKTRQAYAEIDDFIELLADEDKNKIPKKLKEFFKREKDIDYVKEINVDIPLEDQNLQEETINLIAMLYIKYICEDEAEKQELQRIFNNNEVKYQQELREKYNPDNLFNKKKEKQYLNIQEQINNEVQMIEYKESIFKKILSKIMKLLKKR